MFLARRQPLRAAARVQQNLTLRTATARSVTSAPATARSSGFTGSTKRRNFASVATSQPKPRVDSYLQNLPKDYFKTPLPDIKKVLVIGSGGLAIGQAGEFDYSGSQALKALKEAGIASVLLNPNIATIQTSHSLAGEVYFLPVTPEYVEYVLQREKPDGIFLSYGGQTALNLGVQMKRLGLLEKYNVKVLGTSVETLELSEDRDLFAKALEEINIPIAKSIAVESVEEALEAADKVGYPIIVRAAYALGGLGSGFANNREELEQLAARSLTLSPQILVEKSLKGWKEVEYEVVRDADDNCITVCNMENFDPLGIHTGDSIVIAPSQTLSDEEYHMLRTAAIKIIRHLGVVGECNCQYALQPDGLDYRVIEVNARLSRSSALASKATGYPLAYTAAKIGLGSTLPSLPNAVTKTTTANFEPSLDYVVVKIPRWDLAKFQLVGRSIGSAMKSVGEVMAIGRTFEEAIQKAVRMVDPKFPGWYNTKKEHFDDLDHELANPTDRRWIAVGQALQHEGYTVDRVHDLTKIDRWFLHKLMNIVNMSKTLEASAGLESIKKEQMEKAKRLGFSDAQIAMALAVGGHKVSEQDVRVYRKSLGIHPWVKRIDTLAAEFPADTNYLYTTYNASTHDVELKPGEDASVILGSGVYRIGSSVEFDWCAVSATRALREQGKKTIMINYNPEISSPPPITPLSTYSIPISAYRSINHTKLSHHHHNLYQPMPPSTYPPVPQLICPTKCQITQTLTLSVPQLHPLTTYQLTLLSPSSAEHANSDVGPLNLLHGLRRCRQALLRGAFVRACDGYLRARARRVGRRLLWWPAAAEHCSQAPGSRRCPDFGNQPSCMLQFQAVAREQRANPLQDIDKAEDRKKFSNILDSIGVGQPEWAELTSVSEAESFADRVGYPVLVRPSYVLSGAAMSVIKSKDELHNKLAAASSVSTEHPVVISKFIEGAAELDVDGVASKGELLVHAVSEHVEPAGVHSGDATLILPPQNLEPAMMARLKTIAEKVAKAWNITGPFNMQIIKAERADGGEPDLLVIECNLRASRSFPFVSKTLGTNFVDIAAKALTGKDVPAPTDLMTVERDYCAVKVPQFSWTRLAGADPMLGVEMSSTGEIACFGKDVVDAYWAAMQSTMNFRVPEPGEGILLGGDVDKNWLTVVVDNLASLNYKFFCASDDVKELVERTSKAQVTVTKIDLPVNKMGIRDAFQSNNVKAVFSLCSSRAKDITDKDYLMRRNAVDFGVPLMMEANTAMLFSECMAKKLPRPEGIPSEAKPWSEFIKGKPLV